MYMAEKESLLWELKPGQEGRVKELRLSGGVLRRLLDLGMIKGTYVRCVAESPAKDPKAYFIRGAVVAIRKEHSSRILLEENPAEVRRGRKVAALAGNPNVGKSSVFNGLTGLHQHTGNWPGKTVSNARGHFSTTRREYELVDLPGTYSLWVQSAEEEAARTFLCSNAADAVIVVCDATCLERNLNLAFQIMELEKNVILCVNLMDEAKRKGIRIDLKLLSMELGVPVVGVSAHRKKSLRALTDVLDQVLEGELIPAPRLPKAAKASRESAVTGEEKKNRELAKGELFIKRAEEICKKTVTWEKAKAHSFDRKMDKYFTSRIFGYPFMLLLLTAVFWLTIAGANVPSQLLSSFLFGIQDWLTEGFTALGAPEWLHGLLVLGMYRTLAWVVSVMLPPMAIFFPLFTLLEDAGILPRIAFNLDHCFRRCSSCGKQALTMAMGFGCNAAGVMGCRIIDSKRERLIALLTNAFVPCNGRFPTLILLLTLFFAGNASGAWESVKGALLLTGLILLGIFGTFGASMLLSVTVLKGEPSGFLLELPPYRRPKAGQVLLRSVLDRTLFVLGRAAAVAAPAGAVIWLLANIRVGGDTLLFWCTGFLDPFARLLGLDGVILAAFLLGLPANEIVLPILLMAYLQQGQLTELGQLEDIKRILTAQGWSWVTVLCVLVFSLFHWPCSTTLLTIKKETGSWRYTVLAFLLPTAVGMACCGLIHGAAVLFGAG